MADMTITGTPLAHFKSAAAVDISNLKVTFNPTQSGTGDPSPSNVRAISGISSITITRNGKNLFDNTFSDIELENVKYRSIFVGDKPVTFSTTTPRNAANYAVLYGLSGAVNTGADSATNGFYNGSPITVTPQNGYVTIGYRDSGGGAEPENHITQIEIGTSASSYEAYTKQNITAALDDTFYSGYVDLVSGMLTITHKLYTFTGQESTGSINWKGYLVQVPDSKSANNSYVVTMCSHTNNCITGGVFWSTASEGNDIAIAGSQGSQLRFRNRNICADPSNPTLAEYQTYLQAQYTAGTPVQAVYLLETPETYQLTPQTLKTLRGVNNIWSNDGDIEVTYPLNETKDIIVAKKRIIASQPHIAIVTSGNTNDSATIAHFNTDVPANVKELKVTFSAQQSGTGDPSPSNVRPITGVSNVSVTRAGVNLLSVINSTSTERHGITYTEQRNSDGQVTSITAKGTTTQANAFMNLNYEANKFNWIYGKIATCAYSPQVNIPAVLNGGQQWTIDEEWIDSLSSAGWQRYELAHRTEATGEWFRTQIYPYTANTAVDTTIYPLVCLDSDRGCEFEPYRGQIITVALGDTFYGGYVDLVSGTLVQTKYCLTGTEYGLEILLDSYNSSKVTGEIRFDRNNLPIAENNLFISNRFSTTFSSGNVGRMVYLTSNTGLYFIMPREDYGETVTASSIKQWFEDHPTTFVYDLATPIIHQLTPQTLKTLRGINNIWSDQGTVEIKYWTH